MHFVPLIPVTGRYKRFKRCETTMILVRCAAHKALSDSSRAKDAAPVGVFTYLLLS